MSVRGAASIDGNGMVAGTDAHQVLHRILDIYESGDLITTCAWCRRVAIDDEWLFAPRAALTAIDSVRTLSHTICPSCSSGAHAGRAPR
jgi:hypothetical protein